MQTATLKIENINPVRNKKLKISVLSNGINKKQVFWCLVFILALFVASYIYFITQTTLNIVAYKSAEQKIIDINSEISGSEFKYISLKNKINLSLARSLGYIEASNVKFINPDATGQALSLVN